MRFLTAAVAALAVAVSSIAMPATAADLATFTAENVKSIVTEAGGTNVTQEQADGATYVNFDLGGLPYSYSIRLCEAKTAGGCIGLLMAIGFATEETYSLDTLNSFNRDMPVATIVQVDPKTVGFGRFVLSAGGISRENVKANMALLAAAPQLFAAHLKSQVVASTDNGGVGRATPVSAGPAVEPKAVHLTPKALGRLVNDQTLEKLKLR